MAPEVLDILPLPVAARRVGVSAVWLRALVRRGQVQAVADQTGRLYLPLAEIKRLRARYRHHRLRERRIAQARPHTPAPAQG